LGRGGKGQIDRSKSAERAVSISKEKFLELNNTAFDILEQFYPMRRFATGHFLLKGL
jgi:hypothetical protein